jgi:hypothetical protein
MSEELIVNEIEFMMNEVRFSLPYDPDYNQKPFELCEEQEETYKKLA